MRKQAVVLILRLPVMRATHDRNSQPAFASVRLLISPLSRGRSNMRIKGWMGRTDQTTKVKGMFVRPEQIAEIAKRHPHLGRLRLVVTRQGETDVMTLMAECCSPSEALRSEIAATLRAVTKLQGRVELVASGGLPKDGKVISDERRM
jgi:phenylacetate-CoA ligase